MDDRREIDRLYQLEYGVPAEITFRFAAIAAAGIALNLYTGWRLAWAWLGIFFVLHGLYYLYLTSRGPEVKRHETVLAGLMFLVLMSSYIWLPGLLVLQDDEALRISGGAGLASLFVYLILRADSMLFVVLGQIAIVAFTVILTLVETYARIDSMLARVVMTICALGMVGYLAGTILVVRRRRLQAEEAARRSVQAQKMEAIGQLTGGLAHDFNNILTAVLGNLDLYDEIDTRQEKDECVANARQAGRRAADLVRKMLAYSRRDTLNKSVFAVGDFLDGLTRMSRRLIPESVRIELRCADPALRIEADEEQLMTAIINLMINARDAMPGGGRMVLDCRMRTIEAPRSLPDGSDLPPGRYVSISVSDTGTGIAEDIRDRVVEPFFTTKPVGQGSGLGLSMVAGFARQMGGGLDIRSSPGGAIVSILLPLRAA